MRKMLIDTEFAQVCAEGICQTARRLDVDPVAFAEACQDGELLSILVNLGLDYRQACKTEDGMNAWEICHNRIAHKLAALKRAEPKL